MKETSALSISILLVGQAGTCKEIKERLLESGLKHAAIYAANCKKAKIALARNPQVTVILCEYDLDDGNWEEVLSEARETTANPSVVVFWRLADERIWAEALNIGAFDVLSAPGVDKEALVRAVESAHRHCPQVRGQIMRASG